MREDWRACRAVGGSAEASAGSAQPPGACLGGRPPPHRLHPAHAGLGRAAAPAMRGRTWRAAMVGRWATATLLERACMVARLASGAGGRVTGGDGGQGARLCEGGAAMRCPRPAPMRPAPQGGRPWAGCWSSWGALGAGPGAQARAGHRSRRRRAPTSFRQAGRPCTRPPRPAPALRRLPMAHPCCPVHPPAPSTQQLCRWTAPRPERHAPPALGRCTGELPLGATAPHTLMLTPALALARPNAACSLGTGGSVGRAGTGRMGVRRRPRSACYRAPHARAGGVKGH